MSDVKVNAIDYIDLNDSYKKCIEHRSNDFGVYKNSKYKVIYTKIPVKKHLKNIILSSNNLVYFLAATVVDNYCYCIFKDSLANPNVSFNFEKQNSENSSML